MINQANKSTIPITAYNNEYNSTVELVKSLTQSMATCTLVTVQSVDTANKVISALPMVTQIDGSGKPVSQGIIYNVPYLPMQYGNSSIVMTPAVGDIGLCVFCHSDISTVKKTRKEALPGSYRKHSVSDGIYIGGILNPSPINYISFTGNDIHIKATNVIIDANIQTAGTVTNNSVNIGSTHVHELPDRMFTNPPS